MRREGCVLGGRIECPGKNSNGTVLQAVAVTALGHICIPIDSPVSSPRIANYPNGSTSIPSISNNEHLVIQACITARCAQNATAITLN
eukprot:XP_001706273.1 Hypothetical protein GL50803_39713 [Giardia lamblia ATCC 50803]